MNSLFFITSLQAQTVNLEWAKQMGSSNDDIGLSITTDASGNVYTTGQFGQTVDFDPGPGTFNLSSSGAYDIFIQKLDINGDFIWAKNMGGTGTAFGKAIITDDNNNVYTTGQFTNTVDFDPGTGTFDLTSAGNYDIFIQKLDANGNFLWAKSMGETSTDYGYSITTDANGNVYTTGGFNNTVDFDPGTGTANLISTGSYDIFIQKLDANGDFIWAQSMGGSVDDIGYSITSDDNGNIYTTGYFQGTVDFDPGTGIVNLTASEARDIFVQKLNTNGNLVWAKQMGGTSMDQANSIATDADGNVYITGTFRGDSDFDPGAGTANLISVGDEDIFVQKLDVNGNFLWAKQMGGINSDQGQSITTDVYGNVYTTGNFDGTVDFDPGAGTSILTSAGDLDFFIQKLNNNGDFIWAKNIGGTGDDEGYSITIDNNNDIYTTGTFKSTVDFDPGTGVTDLTAAANKDIFIQKLSQCLIPTTSLNGTTITANNALATYVWLNCDDNFSPIAGETNQSFTPTSNGNYAVEVTTTNCLDTSICVAVTTLDLEELDFLKSFSVYPNPTEGKFTIEFNDSQKSIAIRILSILGEEVQNKRFQNTNNIQLELNQPNGVYILEVSDEQKNKAVLKFIKK
jgi:hypothetical protein